MDLGRGILAPGLVDAHAHLEWSLMDGLLPRSPSAPGSAGCSRCAGGWSRRTTRRRPLRGRCGRCAPGTTTLADSGPTGRGRGRDGRGRPARARAPGGLRTRGGATRPRAAAARRRARRRPSAAAAGAATASACPPRPVHRGAGPLGGARAARPDLAGRPWATHLAESADEDAVIAAATARWPSSSPAAGRSSPGAGRARARARWRALAAAGALRAGLVAAHCVQLGGGDPARWPRPAWASPTARARTSTSTAAGRPSRRCARPACPWASARTAPRAGATTTCAPRRGRAARCTPAAPGRAEALMPWPRSGAPGRSGSTPRWGAWRPASGPTWSRCARPPAPRRDPCAAALDPRHPVTTVVIDGEVALADGRPAGIDAAEVETAAARRARRLW